jgi:hypothetical protein
MTPALRVLGWLVAWLLFDFCLAAGLHYSGFWYKVDRNGHQGGPKS